MNIIITNKQFNEDEKAVKAIKDAFSQIIDLFPDLNLSSLESIIIPDDFGKELIQFQKEKQLRSGFTNNDGYLAVGKLMSYIKDGEFNTSMFLDPRIVFLLFDEQSNQNSIHIIHHELCHVHDDDEKYCVFGVTDPEEFFSQTEDKVRQVLYAHADLVWSEYIATRLSAHSKPEDHDMYAETILDLLPKTISECKDEIASYRLHGDISKLFGDIQLATSLFLKTTAYFIGYCHGFNQEISVELNKFIRVNYSYLADVWEPLHTHLQEMYSSYGRWNDIYVLEDLAEIVNRLWVNCGINIENQNGRLFVSVL